MGPANLIPLLLLAASPELPRPQLRALAALEEAREGRVEANVVAQIAVTSVEVAVTGSCPMRQTVRFMARVESVERTSRGVEPGAELVVAYIRRANDCEGPRLHNNPLVEVGDRLPAYLSCVGRSCLVAAPFGAFMGPDAFELAYAEAWDRAEQAVAPAP